MYVYIYMYIYIYIYYIILYYIYYIIYYIYRVQGLGIYLWSRELSRVWGIILVFRDLFGVQGLRTSFRFRVFGFGRQCHVSDCGSRLESLGFGFKMSSRGSELQVSCKLCTVDDINPALPTIRNIP